MTPTPVTVPTGSPTGPGSGTTPTTSSTTPKPAGTPTTTSPSGPTATPTTTTTAPVNGSATTAPPTTGLPDDVTDDGTEHHDLDDHDDDHHNHHDDDHSAADRDAGPDVVPQVAERGWRALAGGVAAHRSSAELGEPLPHDARGGRRGARWSATVPLGHDRVGALHGHRRGHAVPVGSRPAARPSRWADRGRRGAPSLRGRRLRGTCTRSRYRAGNAAPGRVRDGVGELRRDRRRAEHR